ncbi:hypothetical protein Agabi119p4_8760 [Agaricus bisporus var. burnettii]|uniref:SNF5-domain-containing protein n=1 Tax=Agaricus bisporus var. burnettii TaxID=192524 RepID=A0A8H7C427_AGABI|nr:hypothetical protein Agabi119p4_8760 [Agaricus bisporus var. burnettii]
MLAAGFPSGPIGPHQQQQQQHKFPSNAFSGAVNPAQLMGATTGGGGGGLAMAMNLNAMNPNANAMNSGMNPAQLLQQQQQQQQQQQHGMMNGSMGGLSGSGMNMNMMSMNNAMNNSMNMSGMSGMAGPGGINPAALSQAGHFGFDPMAQSQQHPSLHQASPPQAQQQNLPPLTPQQQMMLGALNMTREQFLSLSQQERQQAWMTLLGQMQPLNSNSNHGASQQQQQMMPPPAPPQSQGGSISDPGRPPTSQGHHRPPTAQGHHRPPNIQGQPRPPTAQGMQIHRPPTAQGMQRPPTASGHRGPGPSSTPHTPNAAHIATGMGPMQLRPPTAQDQRHNPSGQQTRPSTAQGMPQTPNNPNAHIAPGNRPPNSQHGIGQQISRPGTAMSHGSPGSASGSASAQSPGARPPSRASEQTFTMNGFLKQPQQQQMTQQSQPNPYPVTPQQPQTPYVQKQQMQQGHQEQFGFAPMNPPATPQNQAAMQGNMMNQQTPQPHQQQQQQMMQANSPFNTNFPGGGMQGSPPPMSIPGSPYRNAKRKIDSSHMGGITPVMSPMGPPSMMPSRMSMSGSSSTDLSAVGGMNGMPGTPTAPIHQGQNLIQSPRPPNTNEMMNSNANFNPATMAMSGGPAQGPPQTPVRQGSMMGGGTPGMGMGNASPMAQALAQQQQQHHHHQQQQARQQSLPSGASPMPKEPGSVGMVGMRASVPPAIPGPNVAGPIARASSTASVTTASGPSAPNVPSSTISGGNTLPASDSTTSTASSSVAGQIPPLPTNVQLNPAITQITNVPLVDSLKLIPEISDEQLVDVKGWLKTDKEYEVVMRKMKERMASEMRGLFGGAMWWEKAAPDVDVNRWKRGRENFDVRYPLRRGKEKEGRERRKRQREGLRLPRKLDLEESERPEQLVPIRLEFDVEHHKMRDTFVWNLNDPVVTPETFAQSIVDDYNLNPNYHSVIVKQIQEQLGDYKAHSLSYDQDSGELVIDLTSDTPVVQGTLDDAQRKWWEAWRKRMRMEGRAGIGGSRSRRTKKKRKLDETGDLIGATIGSKVKVEEDEKNVVMTDVSMDVEEFGRPMAIDEIKLDEELMHEEMRILIKLDIIVGAMKLEDQFEWDLENETVTPEEFSEVYAQDLGLGGEFKTSIAHSIREQIQMYQKSLFLVGHFSDGTPIQDEELRQAFLPSLATGARPMDQVQAYTPLLNSVSDSDIERSEKEREKEMTKRRKRNQRGRRGIVIPDREPIRTYRTPAVGFPELDPATLALAAAANASGSRRAAAAAASLTIANMVASENGTAFIPAPTPMPSVPIPQPKEKKPKGLFKAPSLPNSILRQRAQVAAPTPSTAADVSKLPAPLENDPPPAIPLPPPPPEPKMKYVPKKSQKELEREAKEKEFVDGQHPNYINGVWHCSNCGCPESIAIGRRKGPLGDKSQCGTCGKFWHRHRRPRPVEYNPDPEFHMRKEGDTKNTSKKKSGTQKGQGAAATSTPMDVSAPATPAKNGDIDSRRSPSPNRDDDDRAISPVSTASSASEPPLAQKIKLNGVGHKSGTPRSSAGPKNLGKPITPSLGRREEKFITPKVKAENGHEVSSNTPAPNSPSINMIPPQLPPWLSAALQNMRSRYPDDRFEAILRKTTGNPPDWRIRCLDCPGKLYTPGPGESLSNYEVHLRNRQHRQRVNERLSIGSPQKTS